jgi:hypothetical protein
MRAERQSVSKINRSRVPDRSRVSASYATHSGWIQQGQQLLGNQSMQHFLHDRLLQSRLAVSPVRDATGPERRAAEARYQRLPGNGLPAWPTITSISAWRDEPLLHKLIKIEQDGIAPSTILPARVGAIVQREAQAPALPSPSEEQRIQAEAEQRASARLFTAKQLAAIKRLDDLGISSLPAEKRAGHETMAALLAKIQGQIVGSPAEYARTEVAEAETVFAYKEEAKLSFESSGLVRYEQVVKKRKKTTTTRSWFDAQGRRFGKPPAKPEEEFVAEETRAITERERQRVMKELAEAKTPVVPGREPVVEQLTAMLPGVPFRMHEVAEMPELADPSKYVQMAGSALAKELEKAFEQLRQQYQSYEQSRGEAKKDDIAREFADKLFDTETQLRITQAEQQISESKKTIASLETVKQGLEAARAATKTLLNDGNKELHKQQTALRALRMERGKRGLGKDRVEELDREIAVSTETIKAQNAEIKKLSGQLKELDEQITARGREIRQAGQAVRNLERASEPLKAKRDRFRLDLAFVLDPAQSGTASALAGASVAKLCNVISYFLYGQAVGLIPETRKFADYFLDEFKRGTIVREEYKSGTTVVKSPGIYYGMGSEEWRRNFGMCLYESKKDEAGNHIALGQPSRRAELNEFLSSSARLAITYQDVDHTPPVRPGHFLLIVNDVRKTWRNMDHTSTSYRRRGGETDWLRVFSIASDAAAANEAKVILKKLEEEGAGSAPK